MRFVQIGTFPSGMALVDLEKLSHAVPQEPGSRLYLGNETLDAPHSLDELEDVLAERGRIDSGDTSTAGFSVGREHR